MCDCTTVCMFNITEWRCTKAGGPPPQPLKRRADPPRKPAKPMNAFVHPEHQP